MENKQDYLVGIGAGVATYLGTQDILNRILVPYANRVTNKISHYTDAEKEAYKIAAKDVFEKGGLKSKKFYLHEVNESNIDDITDIFCRKQKAMMYSSIRKIKKGFNDYIAKNPQMEDALNTYINGYQKFLEKSIQKNGKSYKKIVRNVADGENAFISRQTRDFIINFDKMSGLSLHEEGHILNQIGSASKALIYGRYLTAALIPVILAVSLCNKNKNNEQPPEGFKEKTGAFIKNNAGKLTFLAMVPTLAEEGLASIRGVKLAKKVTSLTPELIKKASKNNFLAWTTYLGGAIVTSLAMRFAINVCDRIKNSNKKTV